MLSLFTLHYSQYQFNWIKLKPLDGYFEDTEAPNFSWKDWFSGAYQETADQYLSDNFGFRNFFMRLNNQLRFSLFHKSNAGGVIIGKENYFFEENYIRTWFGDDFIGHEPIEQRMYQLKLIQDTLDQMGKKIITVLAPGKGSFYSEYIPDRYSKKRETTNYEVYRQCIDNWNIHCIDFRSYFMDNKTKSLYPLFPQYGIHWSYYGLCLAADSMVRYIEKLSNIEMPHIYCNNIEIGQPQKDDNDILKAMNLLFTPRSIDMAYPEILFESDSGKTKPSLLVVADSFFWGVYNLGWGYYLFTDCHFWYYNENIYPEYSDFQLTTKDIALKEEIKKYDNIIILCTEGNLWDFGWGFIENAYHVFFKE
jgi:hypothetical protein